MEGSTSTNVTVLVGGLVGGHYLLSTVTDSLIIGATQGIYRLLSVCSGLSFWLLLIDFIDNLDLLSVYLGVSLQLYHLHPQVT